MERNPGQKWLYSCRKVHGKVKSICVRWLSARPSPHKSFIYCSRFVTGELCEVWRTVERRWRANSHGTVSPPTRHQSVVRSKYIHTYTHLEVMRAIIDLPCDTAHSRIHIFIYLLADQLLRRSLLHFPFTPLLYSIFGNVNKQMPARAQTIAIWILN